jgi:hypothetical protein
VDSFGSTNGPLVPHIDGCGFAMVMVYNKAKR